MALISKHKKKASIETFVAGMGVEPLSASGGYESNANEPSFG